MAEFWTLFYFEMIKMDRDGSKLFWRIIKTQNGNKPLRLVPIRLWQNKLLSTSGYGYCGWLLFCFDLILFSQFRQSTLATLGFWPLLTTAETAGCPFGFLADAFPDWNVLKCLQMISLAIVMDSANWKLLVLQLFRFPKRSFKSLRLIFSVCFPTQPLLRTPSALFWLPEHFGDYPFLFKSRPFRGAAPKNRSVWFDVQLSTSLHSHRFRVTFYGLPDISKIYQQSAHYNFFTRFVSTLFQLVLSTIVHNFL